MAAKKDAYPATLTVDYPKKLDRLTSFFRLIWIIPIGIVFAVLTDASYNVHQTSNVGRDMYQSGGIVAGLFFATLLMILFRQRYPRWWFDFNLELNRFSMRLVAYLLLLTDKYPSTTDTQSVHLDLVYPDVEKDLNRWLPLVKWLLAIPHYIVLFFLSICMVIVVFFAWLSILFTGTYPRDWFDFVVGVNRWNLRVSAYAVFLTTDKYPPFSLN